MLNRPDVIEGVHASMVDAGAEVVETDTFQASRLKLEEWGLADAHARDQPQRREIARKAAGEHRFVAGLDRADRPPPRLRRPDARRRSASASSSTIFEEQAAGPRRGRRRPADHRDRAGHPRGQGRDLRRARGVQGQLGRAVPIQCSVSLLPNGGKMLLGTDIDAVLTTLEALKVDVDRPELLDRPRGHARRDPLPRRARVASRSTASRTPACRSRAPTARRSSPRSPAPWPRRSASSSSATASRSSAAAAARRPSTSPRSPSAARPSARARRRPARPAPASRASAR